MVPRQVWDWIENTVPSLLSYFWSYEGLVKQKSRETETDMRGQNAVWHWDDDSSYFRLSFLWFNHKTDHLKIEETQR